MGANMLTLPFPCKRLLRNGRTGMLGLSPWPQKFLNKLGGEGQLWTLNPRFNSLRLPRGGSRGWSSVPGPAPLSLPAPTRASLLLSCLFRGRGVGHLDLGPFGLIHVNVRSSEEEETVGAGVALRGRRRSALVAPETW